MSNIGYADNFWGKVPDCYHNNPYDNAESIELSDEDAARIFYDCLISSQQEAIEAAIIRHIADDTPLTIQDLLAHLSKEDKDLIKSVYFDCQCKEIDRRMETEDL